MSKKKKELSSDEARSLRSLGEKIRIRRESLGITQLELASAVDISDATLRSIENGRKADPGIVTLHRIATVLAMDFDELIADLSCPLSERKKDGKWKSLFALWQKAPLNKQDKLYAVIKQILELESG